MNYYSRSDEGRVMFFCGAGVSRARAGLPDFYGLADAVLNDLKVAKDHANRKVLNEAREICCQNCQMKF